MYHEAEGSKEFFKERVSNFFQRQLMAKKIQRPKKKIQHPPQKKSASNGNAFEAFLGLEIETCIAFRVALELFWSKF